MVGAQLQDFFQPGDGLLPPAALEMLNALCVQRFQVHSCLLRL